MNKKTTPPPTAMPMMAPVDREELLLGDELLFELVGCVGSVVGALVSCVGLTVGVSGAFDGFTLG